jgi:hypothetical protein
LGDTINGAVWPLIRPSFFDKRGGHLLPRQRGEGTSGDLRRPLAPLAGRVRGQAR